ncbi:MAG TPA: MXAN_5187 C-terminal domain-containing protein [Myxococcales bacterium]|nr:MXAN_5187 C-terminal domain-containing protein [Myxococcales bacterium]
MATPSGDILNRKIVEGGEVAKECGEIEEAIAALRMSYEQYFLGIERRPPTQEHNDLKKRLQRIRGAFVRQTALKFRIQALQAKLVTYERLWTRTLQEIENGTYRRDLFKAKLHAQERAEKAKHRGQKGAGEPEIDESEAVTPPPEPALAPPGPPPAPAPRAAAPNAKPAAAAAAAAVKSPAPPAARPPPSTGQGNGALASALSDQKLKAVFDAYVTAKRRCQEDVSKLSYEQVAANLRKQVPDLVKKAGAQGVEFKIVIKDGKAILRAVPK